MKILIAFSDKEHLKDFFDMLECTEDTKSFTYKHIDLDFLETGYTHFETAYHMGIALHSKSYHLVLFAGLANSLNTSMRVGDLVNVIKDIPYLTGIQEENEFKDAYELTWLDRSKFPHQRGAFINMSNSYFNVFLPYMKTASLSCSSLEGTEEQVKLKIAQYPIHIETSNGIGFHYACLSKKLPFYQLRSIAKNLVLKNEDKELALKNLNLHLKDIIDLL
ncbi:MAG: hypothetical protein H6579_09755 [Chitinophagales bacterium]|nr:hypothetical protein [Chitinophagales bacterium]